MRPCSRTAVGGVANTSVATTMRFSPSSPHPPPPPVVNCSVRKTMIDDTIYEALESTQPTLVSGFTLHGLGGEPLSDSETSSLSSSSGSSAVGAYAMFALNEKSSADEAADYGPSPLPTSPATSHDDCSLASPFAHLDDEGLCRRGSDEISDFFRSAQCGINPGRSAAVPATRSLVNKVRALSSECLEGLGWAKGRGGGKGHWRGRSESEPRLPGAYSYVLLVKHIVVFPIFVWVYLLVCFVQQYNTTVGSFHVLEPNPPRPRKRRATIGHRCLFPA